MNFCIIYFWQQRKSHASSYWLIIVCSTCMKVLNSATYIRALFPWSFQFLRIWRNSLQTPQKRWVWVQVSRDVLLLTGAADQPATKRTLTASLGSWSHRQLATSLGTLTQEKKKNLRSSPGGLFRNAEQKTPLLSSSAHRKRHQAAAFPLWGRRGELLSSEMPRGQSFQLAGLRTLNRSLRVSSFPRTFLCQRARRRTRKQPGSLCSHPQRGGQQRGDSGRAGTRRRTSRLSAPALPQPPRSAHPTPQHRSPRRRRRARARPPAPSCPPGWHSRPAPAPAPRRPHPVGALPRPRLRHGRARRRRRSPGRRGEEPGLASATPRPGRAATGRGKRNEGKKTAQGINATEAPLGAAASPFLSGTAGTRPSLSACTHPTAWGRGGSALLFPRLLGLTLQHAD